MPDIWLYHPAEPQGRIVDTSIVDTLMLEGWVKSPRDLPPGLFFGNDGTHRDARIPLDPVVDVAPAPALAVPTVAPEPPQGEEDPGDNEGKFKDMTRLELIAYAKNTYGETISKAAKRADIIAKLKSLEEL